MGCISYFPVAVKNTQLRELIERRANLAYVSREKGSSQQGSRAAEGKQYHYQVRDHLKGAVLFYHYSHPSLKQRALIVHLADNSVGGHHKDKTHYRLIYAGRGGHADIVCLHQPTVDIGIYGVGHINKGSGVHGYLIKKPEV